MRGAKDDPYTAGVICEKVARYAERIHHPNRLLYPLATSRQKGRRRVAADLAGTRRSTTVAAKLLEIEKTDGPLSIWPYFYAGTMGHVHRDGIDRLRHARGYSNQYDTICTGAAWPGYIAGTGLLTGPNPEQMAESDCVVIWGTNAVHTQVNVMTHAVRARKERGAKIVVVDIYRTAHDGAGRHGPDAASGLRRRAGARGDARPPPRGARGPRLPRRSSPTSRPSSPRMSRPGRRNGRRRSPG